MADAECIISNKQISVFANLDPGVGVSLHGGVNTVLSTLFPMWWSLVPHLRSITGLSANNDILEIHA